MALNTQCWRIEWFEIKSNVYVHEGKAFWMNPDVDNDPDCADWPYDPGTYLDEADLLERNEEKFEYHNFKHKAIDRARKIIKMMDDRNDWFIVRCYPIILQAPNHCVANPEYDAVEVELNSDNRFEYQTIPNTYDEY